MNVKSQRNDSPVCVKVTAAEEIVGMAVSLAEYASSMANRMADKLQPVMMSDSPHPDCKNGEDYQEYPPLFADLRNNFQAIKDSLNYIERLLSRTEL